MPVLAISYGEFTYAQYQSWPAQPRYELLDGYARAMAPPNINHQTVVFELGAQLRNQLIGKPCRAFAGPVGVRLPLGDERDEQIRTVFEPDLLVVCDPRKIDAKGIRCAPDLVIEVLSPSTAAYDLVGKRGAYDRAGVLELLLIDVSAGVITRYTQQPETQRFGGADILYARGELRLFALPELVLDLEFMLPLRLLDEEGI